MLGFGICAATGGWEGDAERSEKERGGMAWKKKAEKGGVRL